MARYAVVDGSNGIVSFSTVQTTFNPEKGNAEHPAPWKSLPCPEVLPPAFDPATQALIGPTYKVNPTDVTEQWTVRPLTQGELDASKDNQVSAMDTAVLTVLFNHENRIRALESKPAITKAQFITAIKALL